MHSIQEKILKIADHNNLSKMSLRKIGKLVNVDSAQRIKHHLYQLEKKGLIVFDQGKNILRKVKSGEIQNTNLIAVPILGSADCGPASIFAEQNLEGYLKISKKMLSKKGGIFAIRAVGPSMNKANINGKSIEDGDYVIVDSKNKTPRNGDYILSIIDACANIKRFIQDKKNKQIVLLSESTFNFPPIYIHPEDFLDYIVSGRVIQIIKKPKINWV